VSEHGCDAIFVGNDHMAFAVMDHLRGAMKISVPNDVSIVGYDDVSMAAWGAYELTTLRQPVNRMVHATVDTLLAMIEDADASAGQITIDGPLVVRTSAKVPKEN
jgi:DNA-binding LacI/PurR family transcriptional regulator